MLPRRAAGIEDLDLDLSSQIDGHRPTALLAVRQLMSVLINLDLSSNDLGPSCMATLSTALHENASLEVSVAAPCDPHSPLWLTIPTSLTRVCAPNMEIC